MRCKFRVDKIERILGSVPVVDADGKTTWEKGEVTSIHMNPVYGNGDPNHENTKFWQASPSGSFFIGTVNKAAVEEIELGKEYYIDITLAE